MQLDTSKNLVNLATVSRACDEIVKSGNQPSVRKVMEHLGGGSPNRIAPLVKRWRAEHTTAQATPRVVIDPRIIDIFSAQIFEAVKAASVNADNERDSALSDLQLLSEKGFALEEQAANDAERLLRLESDHLKGEGMISAIREELVLSKIEMSRTGEVIKAEAAEAVLLAKKITQEEREKSERLNIQLGTLAARLENQTEKLQELRLAGVNLRQTLASSEATCSTAIQNASVCAARFEAMQHRTDKAESQREKLIGAHESAVQNLHQAELQIQNYQLKNQALMHELELARQALIHDKEQLKPPKAKKSVAEAALVAVTDPRAEDLFNSAAN